MSEDLQVQSLLQDPETFDELTAQYDDEIDGSVEIIKELHVRHVI